MASSFFRDPVLPHAGQDHQAHARFVQRPRRARAPVSPRVLFARVRATLARPFA